MVIIDNLWVFNTQETARQFAYLFLETNNFAWSGLKTVVGFATMSALLKYCLDKEIINKEDLFTTDNQVWTKIRPLAEKDERLKLLIDRADNKFGFKFGTKDSYDLHAFCKSRVVDPLFLEGKNLKRVSEIDLEFLKLKEQHAKPKEYYIRCNRV